MSHIGMMITSYLSWPLAAGLTLVFGALVAAVRHRVPTLALSGKRVFITGGSTGIGLEMAREFLTKGALVCISARRTDVLEAAVADLRATTKCGDRVWFHAVDVSDEAAISKAVATVEEKWAGGVDILVCCAGFSHPTRFLDTPSDIGHRMMEVNFFGCVNTVRGFLPAMYKRGSGRVALVSSMAAVANVAGFTLYSPTKAALRSFAACLDMESAARGVRVQVINPPDVDTPGYKEEMKFKSPECREICEMSGSPWPAAEIGKVAVRGIESYSFQVNFGFDGLMLGSLSANMDPPTSYWRLGFEVLFAGFLRLVIAIYGFFYYRIVRKALRREGLLATGKPKTQ